MTSVSKELKDKIAQLEERVSQLQSTIDHQGQQIETLQETVRQQQLMMEWQLGKLQQLEALVVDQLTGTAAPAAASATAAPAAAPAAATAAPAAGAWAPTGPQEKHCSHCNKVTFICAHATYDDTHKAGCLKLQGWTKGKKTGVAKAAPVQVAQCPARLVPGQRNVGSCTGT